jgi:citronellol/citronellal dehydrogenase
VNALWPRTAIATAAVQNLLGGDTTIKKSRSTEIMSDAAYEILIQDKSISGNFYIVIFIFIIYRMIKY